MDFFTNFFVAAVLAGTPLLFGILGEIINEKSGHLNLGVEGMMSIGACAGFIMGYKTDNLLLALIAAFAAGMLGALIYAVLTVTFMADQNVTGLTLTIFGIGLSNFFGDFFREKSGETSLKLPAGILKSLGKVEIPVLSDIPVLGKLFFNYNIFVYLGIVAAILCGIYLHRTKAGLNIRAVGENPAAADAAGLPVTRLKYLNLMLGGGICGLGGAYCSMIICNGVWISNCKRPGMDRRGTGHLCHLESQQGCLCGFSIRRVQCTEVLCAQIGHQDTGFHFRYGAVLYDDTCADRHIHPFLKREFAAPVLRCELLP